MFNKAGKYSGTFTAVYKPTITSPTASQIVASRTPTITGSAFSKYGNITHASTDWQVSDTIDFTTIRWSSLTDATNKTSIVTADLAGGDRYVRVRYRASNGVVSEWSNGVLFTSPWASGSNATLTSSTNMDVNASTTVGLQTGTYRIYLWGGGGGGAAGGGRGGASGGGAGGVYRDVGFTAATNVSFTIGTGGGGGNFGTNLAGSGGVPSGGAGLQIGSDFWNGAGGGGYSNSSTLSMTAAGGGGAGGDNGSTAAGGAGGSGDGSAGREWILISSSGGKSGGFNISSNYDNNFSQNTGCNVSGTYNATASFSNMQGTLIDVKLTASGPDGTITDERTCTTGTSLSVSFTGNYPNVDVYYRWCGSGKTNVSTNLSVSWSGRGTSRSATAGTSGAGGGGGGCISNGEGSTGGKGGTNSGSFTSSSSGSGSNAGNRYYSSTYGRYFGDGGGAGSAGQNGGARIERIATQNIPVVSITSNLATTYTATAGGSNNFSITATDTANNDSTVTYQWYLSTNGGSTYSAISGATSSTLTRYNPFYYSDNSHKIYCRATVTNTAGTNSVNSNICTLTVNRNFDCNSTTVTGSVELSGTGLKPSAPNSGQVEEWGSWSPGFSDICEINGSTNTFSAGGRCNFCQVGGVYQGYTLQLELRITRSTDGTAKHWGNQQKSSSTCDSGGASQFSLNANGGGWTPESDGTPTYRLVVIGDGTNCNNGAGEDIGPQQFSSCTLNYSYKRRTYYYETRP